MKIFTEDDLDIEKDEFIGQDAKKHNLIGTGKVRKTVKERKMEKTSVLPSIELPHPGMSYNPSFQDHQELLKVIVEKEKKVIKEEEHLKRVTNKMFKKVTADQRDVIF